MTIVVDASAALKLVVDEDGSDRVRELLLGPDTFIAPDFQALECCNVLATRVRRDMMSAADARASLDVLNRAPITRVPSPPHFAEAHRLAVELSRSAYDCLYLAVALAENATLVTADRRFAEAVQREPAYVSAIRLL